MKKRMMARVTWVEAKDGGRIGLPTGRTYSTVSKFQEEAGDGSGEAWSVILEFPTAPATQGNPSTGIVHFLADEAPQDRLVPGRTFELYEGKRRVATVELLAG